MEKKGFLKKSSNKDKTKEYKSHVISYEDSNLSIIEEYPFFWYYETNENYVKNVPWFSLTEKVVLYLCLQLRSILVLLHRWENLIF